MSEAIFNRLVAIVENGTYGSSGTTSLGAKALRSFPSEIDTISGRVVLILPRGDSGWQKESGAGTYITTLSYELSFYIHAIASNNNSVLGIADAVNFNALAVKIFLSRPQLQLSPVATYPHIPEIAGEITWQTTSNLANPIPYPPNSVSVAQGASLHWGFVSLLTVPYRQFIEFKVEG